MTIYESNIMGVLNPPVTASQAGLVIVSIGETASIAGGDLESGDIIKLCKLPANHIPLDFILEAESLEGGSDLTLTAGVINSSEDGLVSDTNFFADDDVAQGGGVKRAGVIDGLGLTASDSERIIGLKVTTVAGSGTSGALRGKLFYTANP